MVWIGLVAGAGGKESNATKAISRKSKKNNNKANRCEATWERCWVRDARTPFLANDGVPYPARHLQSAARSRQSALLGFKQFQSDQNNLARFGLG